MEDNGTFKEFVGQKAAVSALAKDLKRNQLARVLLFVGPSGTGKTTLARILKSKLECSDDDYQEINCASSRGIEMTRSLQQEVGLAPMLGKWRIWCLDEVHRLTSDAQSSLLKTLEDVHEKAYFFLCTTDPQKLLPTIKTRCTTITLQPIPATDMRILLDSVIEKEGTPIVEKVVDRIVEVAEGSARKALVLLHQVIGLEDEEEQLKLVQADGVKKQSWDLVKALLYERPEWSKIAAIIKGLDGEEPEQIRRHVLACAGTEVLKGGRNAGRASFILQEFEANWFDSGRSGLIRASWEVANLK